jgi:hypothetical protein
MITFHPNAPASRIAHARHPLLRRLIKAFQPFSAQNALASISMSDPNCRRRVSECIFLDALSSAPSIPPSAAPPPSVWLEVVGESILDVLLSVRLRTGDKGISCSCGCGWKPVMQSMTSTLATLLGGAGVRLGR